MTIDTIRRIDYFLGIFFCFLLDVLNFISTPFQRFKKFTKPSHKILFIKLTEMGSIILAHPLVAKIKKEYPDAEVFFLTFKKNKPLIELLEITVAGNIFTINEESPRLLILDTIKALNRIRKAKMEVVFDLEFFSRFSAVLTYLSGGLKRVGFYRYTMEGLYRGNLLTHRVQYNPLIHTSKSYLSLGQVFKPLVKLSPEMAERIDDRQVILTKFIPSQELNMQIRSKLRAFNIVENDRLFLINPGEGILPLREWPLENFIILSKKILADNARNYLIIVGSQGAAKKAKILHDSLASIRCVDFSGNTGLPELLALFHISKLLIVNDSGLAHLASLTPINQFVFFGPENQNIYAPGGGNTRIIYSDLPCSPCLSAFNHRNSACKDNQCLKKIKPDEVYELMKIHAATN